MGWFGCWARARGIHTVKELFSLLETTLAAGGSDLHVLEGFPPSMRVGVRLEALRTRPLRREETEELLRSIVPEGAWERLGTSEGIRFCFSLGDKARVRCRAFRYAGGLGATFRVLPMPVPKLANLGLPPLLEQILGLPSGLILVTGPARSGKSTTLAAIAEWLARRNCKHIVTLESPIEFPLRSGPSVVSQREIPADVPTLSLALRELVWEDVDVVFVSTLDDPEAMVAAFELAESGTLVVGSLCTIARPCSLLRRLVSLFSGAIRRRLAFLCARQLLGVLCQRLLPQADGRGSILLADLVLLDEEARKLLAAEKFQELAQHLSAAKDQGIGELGARLEDLAAKGSVPLAEAKLELALLQRSEQWL
jgi:twitching motility protein PilT